MVANLLVGFWSGKNGENHHWSYILLNALVGQTFDNGYLAQSFEMRDAYLTASSNYADRSAGRNRTFYSTGQTLVLYGKTMGVARRVGH